MARATPTRSTDTAAADAALPFADWLESQQRFVAVAMDQWSGLHEAWLRGMQQQFEAWNALWQADGAATPAAPASWADVPAAYADAMQRAAQAWWGPWLPMLQRGGEQLA